MNNTILIEAMVVLISTGNVNCADTRRYWHRDNAVNVIIQKLDNASKAQIIKRTKLHRMLLNVL